jgi:hypothetical protein
MRAEGKDKMLGTAEAIMHPGSADLGASGFSGSFPLLKRLCGGWKILAAVSQGQRRSGDA